MKNYDINAIDNILEKKKYKKEIINRSENINRRIKCSLCGQWCEFNIQIIDIIVYKGNVFTDCHLCLVGKVYYMISYNIYTIKTITSMYSFEYERKIIVDSIFKKYKPIINLLHRHISNKYDWINNIWTPYYIMEGFYDDKKIITIQHILDWVYREKKISYLSLLKQLNNDLIGIVFDYILFVSC